MTKLVFSYAAAINVSPPPSVGGKINNGSGFVLRLDHGLYLVTAWHVVKFWLDRVGAGEKVLFQVRDALLVPSERIVWRDEENDIAFLDLRPEEVEKVNIHVCEPIAGWPPPHPPQGSYVLVSGFPAVIRKRPQPANVEFNALSSMLPVTSSRERHVVCQVERDDLVSFDEHGVPPPGTDLGGMSGGPALLVGKLSYPVVGLISEFSKDYELLYIRTLSHVPAKF